MKKDLTSVKEGISAEVKHLSSDGLSNRRLLDLGFVPGTRITCLYAAPSVTPRAYLVRGAVVALRQNDAKKVLIF